MNTIIITGVIVRNYINPNMDFSRNCKFTPGYSSLDTSVTWCWNIHSGLHETQHKISVILQHLKQEEPCIHYRDIIINLQLGGLILQWMVLVPDQ